VYKINNEINNMYNLKRKIESINVNSNQIKKQKLHAKFIELTTYKDIFNCTDKVE